jgi:anti-sigma factor RsiW
MATAIDGDISAADREALERHVEACATCRRELAATQALFAALDELPREREVPLALEAATLRRVRMTAADEAEAAARRWWGWLPVPLLAAAGASAVALVIATRPGDVADSPSGPAPAAEPPRIARAPAPPAPTAAERGRGAPEPGRDVAGPAELATAATPPAEPPPDLAAAPELFMNLPIIRNMEKLEHFEAISMVQLQPNG